MKVFIIGLVAYLATIANLKSQDCYYLDCPVTKQMFTISEKYDSVNLFEIEVRRSENNISYPLLYRRLEEYKLRTKNKFPLNSYRLIILPSKDYSEFLVSSFSRNFCFQKEEDINNYVTPISEYVDMSHSNSYSPLGDVEIHPMCNVWLMEYYSKLNDAEISILERTIVNSFANTLIDYTDYCLAPNNKEFIKVSLFYVDYKMIDNSKFIKNKIEMYFNENPLYYSMPNKSGVKLSQNSIRYKPDTAFINKDSLIIIYSERLNEIGFKFPITIEPFLLNENTDSEIAYKEQVFGSSIYSNFGFKIECKYIGVVYLNEKNVTETLWILKEDLYSTLKDKTFENMLEMILKNKIINRISHDNY